jgi:hypothetical protein
MFLVDFSHLLLKTFENPRKNFFKQEYFPTWMQNVEYIVFYIPTLRVNITPTLIYVKERARRPIHYNAIQSS